MNWIKKLLIFLKIRKPDPQPLSVWQFSPATSDSDNTNSRGGALGTPTTRTGTTARTTNNGRVAPLSNPTSSVTRATPRYDDEDYIVGASTLYTPQPDWATVGSTTDTPAESSYSFGGGSSGGAGATDSWSDASSSSMGSSGDSGSCGGDGGCGSSE